MGCVSSSSGNPSSTPEITRKLSSKNSPLTDVEIQARIEAPKQYQTVTIGGIKYKYAWVSQRGYYPDSPDKDNQDTFTIQPKFGMEGQAFFGVFDGHGKEGHLCARYIRDQLPKTILSKLDKIQNNGSVEKSVKSALTAAHLTTNEALHADNSIDDTLSGTTAISILFREKTMYISNVGDSRAIIGYVQSDGRIVAKPMSSDQTPYRKDERERVKKYGARILSMDQIEGLEPVHENWGDVNLGEDIDEGGDPPRVWSPHGDYPGTAFTRSFGDLYAEELGVTAEAEILVRDVVRNDKFIIIASDGVFEFLTNQMVIDMAAQTDNPLDACNVIVNSAYNMWLQYEIRTDDITIIAIYVDNYGLDDLDQMEGDNLRGSFSAHFNTSREERPVRRAVSREKRKHIILAQDEEKIETETDLDQISLKIEKTDIERSSIEDAIRSNFLFQHLNHSQRQKVIDVMQPVMVSKGDWVIRQGDKGDRFYVIESGEFEVRVCPPGIDDPSGGPVVHVYISGPGQHPGFGELSLMYGKPRAASVIALTDGKLWALDRKVFRTVVMRSTDARKAIIRTLKKVDVFKALNNQQLQRLTDLFVEDSFPENHYIIHQGEVGDNFYLIVKGSCDCTINSKENPGTENVVLQLHDNDYFGEKALLTSNPRAANVITKTPTKVLYINKKAFEEVLGPLSAIIDEDRKRREAAASVTSSSNRPRSLSDIHVIGVVSQESASLVLLGSFGSSIKTIIPNVTVRSFILSEVDRMGISSALMNSIDIARTITNSTSSNSTSSSFVPKLLSVLKDNNAYHLVHDTAIICDLATIIISANVRAGYPESFPIGDDPTSVIQQPLRQDVVAYIAASIVLGLESLHSLGIAYRALQPESIYIDMNGGIVLIDYRVSKLGLNENLGRTFTICGATDYLSPEQISQRGHTTSVDLWAFGTLLYELSVGIHPFNSSSEVATYAKISSFGTKAYPSLTFPEYVSSEIKSIINQLLVPTPEARLGAGPGGFDNLKKHALFRGIEWKTFSSVKSPLLSLTQAEYEELCQEKIDNSIFESFSREYTTDSNWDQAIDMKWS